MLIPVLLAAIVAAAAPPASPRSGEASPSEAEFTLARSLAARGLPVSASVYYARITARGTTDPYYAKALQAEAEIADRIDDAALPAAGADVLDALPPEIAGRVAYALASSAYRAGRWVDADALVQRVPQGDASYPRAQYLAAVLARRGDPDKALRIFGALARLDPHGSPELAEVKELAQLGIGRTLYGMRRYAEASTAYKAVPRFSRHWDEALFEGAYADLRAGDPGAALGKLHTLRAPQLRDAFAPESENLAAIIYHRNCLWPQVREALSFFQQRYLPMRDRIEALLAKKPSPAELIAAFEGRDALPGAVRGRIARDERLAAALAGLHRIAAEQRQVEADRELSRLLSGYRAQAEAAAAKRLVEKLSELVHVVASLDGENEIVTFETTKGEKEFLETSFDPGALLASQTLRRPKLSPKGEEYWQFDGEYWPDEIGYYRYTLKDACPSQREAAPTAAAPAPNSAQEAARDAAVDAKRDEMIGDLGRILRKVEEGTRKADINFQLAELWWEKAGYVSLQEVRDYDERYGAWLAKREKDAQSAGAEPKVSTEKSDGYRKKALALYQDILARYPAYARKDELLFVLAYNQYEIGDRPAALRSYQALIDEFPASRFVPDAYVQMGEHYFQHDDLAHARAAFEKAVAFRLPKVYAFALYKLAWCDYNAQDYRAAIAKFEEVIDYSERQPQAGDRIQLKNEALKDLVLPFAQTDVIEGASAYFDAKAGAGSVELIDRLAAAYFESGKFDQAIRVYRLLQNKAPEDARASLWQQKILLAYDKLNQRDAVAREMERLVSTYGPRSDWAKAKAAKGASLDEANQSAESALRELVQDYHQEAIKTKSAATYRLARDIYRRYLDAFADSESAYYLRFYYAEILYALEEWDAAAGQYALVAEANPQGEYAQKAAYDAILALQKAVAVAQGKLRKGELEDGARVDEQRPKGEVEQGGAVAQEAKTGDEEPIPEIEQKLVAACERYSRFAPQAADQAAIRYKAAFIFYQHRHYAEAGTRFAEIVRRWPASPIAQKAADLSLDTLNSRQDWVALGDLANELRRNRALAPPGSEFAQRTAKIEEGARFKYALDIYEEKKDSARAANEFKKFVEEYPRSEYAPVALNDCVVIAEQGEQLDLVIEAATRLLEKYPEAPDSLRKPAMLSLASAYERTARFSEAVRWYEQYAASWPADPKAPDQLFNAALWREGAGDDGGALADWHRYVRQYGSRADAPRIAFNIGLVLERQQDWKKASTHWREFQRDYQRRAPAGQLLLARYKEGFAREKLEKRGGAAAFTDVAQRFRTLPQAERTAQVIDAAAHARFLIVEPVFETFLGVHFRSPRQAEVVAALKSKNARMAALVTAYREVVALGSPRWSEAALTRLGEAYSDFNKGLLEAPAPRGLDAEQRELYRSTLQNQALPLEDKAVDAFREVIEISHRTGFYSEWTQRAQRALREYRPDQVAEVHQPALVGSVDTRAIPPPGIEVRAAEGNLP